MPTKDKEKDFICNNERRELLKKTLTVAPLVPCLLTGSVVHAEDQEEMAEEKKPPQVGDKLTWFAKSKRGKIIKVDDLKLEGRPKIALPYDCENDIVRSGSNYNQILVQRLDAETLDEATQSRSEQGVIAYSAICTHNGCPVSGWSSEQKIYMCPCHQSVYDPRKAATVVSGPAPRPLPAIPVSIAEDGSIEIAGDFTSRVGFGKK